MSSPEELAREKIDALLTKCGWTIQHYKQLNLSAARGIAIRQVPLCGSVRSLRDHEYLEADNVLSPIYKVFGEKLWRLMEELILTLAE
jgi:hypothetical protein